MSEEPYDTVTYKARQREQWSNAAEGWRRRWAAFERGAQPLSDRMMALAHVAAGQRVLDVATGIGEPAMTAARLVGAGGAVVAVDQAPQMLAVARERMDAAGLRQVQFIESDAECVSLPPDAFDAIVCRWGLMFFTDPDGSLARLRTSLVPGGWMVAAVWGPPQRVPLIALPFAALAGAGETPPPTPSGPSPFALSTPAALERVARLAGYTEIHSEPYTVTFDFPSVAELRGHLADVSSQVRVILATQTAEQQAAFWQRLADAATRYAQPDGAIRLENECLIVAGRRPA
ncbi:MAG TPA: methyltransferase domain-containing protein [Ktedonobacterales bacterium]|nr:methyltransferase domain-containing protein [Ktedonobacterales bacterium]